MNNLKKSLIAMCLMLFIISTATKVKAQYTDSPAAKEMIASMNKAADDWNKGNLASYMSLYDASATMMMPKGPAGMDGILGLYQKVYFKDDGMPKQNLRYTDMKVRMLGTDYALLTGGFTLYGNNVTERSGRYSLVMVHTANGWKILHDHSS